MRTRAISIGILKLSGLMVPVILGATLIANPGFTALSIGWSITAVLGIAGLYMYLSSEKEPTTTGDKEMHPPKPQTTGITMKVGKHALISGVKLEGFDKAIDMDVDENGYIADVSAKASEKKK